MFTSHDHNNPASFLRKYPTRTIKNKTNGAANMNPKQMQQMMKQLGIQQVEVPATQVIIKLEGNKELVIDNPQVSKVNAMGQVTYQVIGHAEERASNEITATIEITDEDIQTVMEQTGASHEKALLALEENEGDLASAIMALKK